MATTQSTTEFSDGNRIVRSNTVRYFRDGQGRTRIERGVSGEGEELTAQPNPTIMIHDPVGGRFYILNPQNKTAIVYKMPSRGNGAVPTTAPQEPIPGYALMGLGMAIGAGVFTEASSAETSLGQKVISGVNTTGRRIVRTIPSGVLGNEKPIISTFEEWRSLRPRRTGTDYSKELHRRCGQPDPFAGRARRAGSDFVCPARRLHRA